MPTARPTIEPADEVIVLPGPPRTPPRRVPFPELPSLDDLAQRIVNATAAFKAALVLDDVKAPPCPDCNWWAPQLLVDTDPPQPRMCHTPAQQERDFSCFTVRE